MKMNEVVNLSDPELDQKEKALRKELTELNLKKRMGTLIKTHQCAQIRRTIARISTIKSARKTKVNQ